MTDQPPEPVDPDLDLDQEPDDVEGDEPDTEQTPGTDPDRFEDGGA